MGAQLVGLVLSRWKHLNDTDFRILIRMALTALDQEKDGHPPHLYFGGHEFLAMALRRPFPEGDSEQSRKARQNILRDVRRSVKGLVDQGAIEVVDTGRAVRQGVAKTYRLTLWSAAGVLTPSSAGAENPSATGHTAGGDDPSSAGGDDPCSGGVLSPQEQGVTTPPRNHGGAREETREEDRADTGDQPQDAREEAEPLRLVPTEGVRDPRPAGGGVPGQLPMLTAITSPVPEVEDVHEDQGGGIPPYGRCGGCHRPLARPGRTACAGCA
ncbi:hypothetical protein [Streptomyces europaeiscabiei]|uniref:hypothetical protein n=1 Tax=Streptomyces europaeiscabiei TaxID=146819 RepID=UPI0029BE635A|nr:hypothetical protein [Streptomyces europaeiscabiei]MDX3868016.1 hypothetical protein [Streptomyces europaeiscabiei]